MRADKRYYVNADRSKIVEESDPDATHLLAAEGDDISNEDVKKYGLDKKKAETVEVKSEEKPQAKAVEVPPENKARQMTAQDSGKK